MKYVKTFGEFVNELKAERENINEAFEWLQPLLAIGASVGLVAGAFYAILAPSAIVGGPFMGPEGWGDVVRYYKKKFKDKQAAKRLTKEDVLELINLIQTNITELPKGERNYMKSLINRLEAEMNKDKEELDKDNLLVLLRDVKKYAKRKGVNVSDATLTNESINEAKLRGQLAGDSAEQIAKELEYYVELMPTSDTGYNNKTVFKIKNNKKAVMVVKMLKDIYGIKSRIDTKSFYPTDVVVFDNDQIIESLNNESVNEAKDYGQGNPWNPSNTQTHIKKLMKKIEGRPGPYSLLLITPHNMKVVKQEINIKDSRLIPAYFRNWASKFTDSIIRLEDGEGHIVESVNEATTDRFLQSAARNLAKQMRGKSASRTTLMNRLNSMPLANRLKPAELDKIVDYAMQEMGLNEAKYKVGDKIKTEYFKSLEEFVNESVNEKKQLPKEIKNHKDIPSWARYVAQHSDGEWTWYEETPTIVNFKNGGGAWKQDGNQIYTGVKTDGKDWNKMPTYYYVKNGKITESFDEPGYRPHKLKNSRIVMKTRDEIEAMIRGGKRHHVEKLLDKVNDIKHKLQDKYNREQEGHDRYKITSSLSADMTYLRSYAKIINYLLEKI